MTPMIFCALLAVTMAVGIAIGIAIARFGTRSGASFIGMAVARFGRAVSATRRGEPSPPRTWGRWSLQPRLAGSWARRGFDPSGCALRSVRWRWRAMRASPVRAARDWPVRGTRMSAGRLLLRWPGRGS